MDFYTSSLVLLSLLVTGNLANISVDNFGNANAHSFNKTTVFTNIIFGDMYPTHDAVYATPALLLVGKSSGDILRCLFKNPHTCETFHSSSSEITGIVTHGEYIYASQKSGTVIRCNLHNPNSCLNFIIVAYVVNCLTVSAGYIYAGLANGHMLRCDLHNKDNCKTLNKFNSGITALGASDEYIYAGLTTGDIRRCSLASENSCRFIITKQSAIIGISAVDDTIVAVRKSGYIWNCTSESRALNNNCSDTGIPSSDYKSIAIFNGSLYGLQSQQIWICKRMTNSFIFSSYIAHDGASSFAFAYSTYKMQRQFENEDKTCLANGVCPPFVVYYEVNQRVSLEVTVKGGKLFNSQEVVVDTSNADFGQSSKAAIFAMGPDGQILVSNVHNSVLRISSLFAGNPVAGAGEIVVDAGVIRSIRACSEHYRPDVDLNKQVIDALYLKGYTASFDSLPCSNDSIRTENTPVKGGQVDTETDAV